VAICLIAALSGCGQVQSSAAGGAADAAAVDDAAATASLTALAERIYGDLADQRAGEVVFFRSFQDAVQQCMAERGFDYQRPPFVDIYAGQTDSRAVSSVSSWVAPLGEDLSVARNAEVSAAADRAMQALPARADIAPGTARGKAYDAAMNTCSPRGQEQQQENIPTEALRLGEQLIQSLDRATATPRAADAVAAYPGCMAAAGFDDVASRDELVETVAARRDGVTSTDSAAFARLVEHEQRAVAADARCRQRAAAAVAAASAPLLKEFVTEHTAELDEVDRAWQSYRALAAAYPE